MEQNEGYGELQSYANQFNKKIQYDELMVTLSSTSIDQLAAISGLSEEDYKQLMTTQFIDEVIYLCLKGLKQVKNQYDHN